MSRELLQFLSEKVVASGRITSFNPAGNGQVEPKILDIRYCNIYNLWVVGMFCIR